MWSLTSTHLDPILYEYLVFRSLRDYELPDLPTITATLDRLRTQASWLQAEQRVMAATENTARKTDGDRYTLGASMAILRIISTCRPSPSFDPNLFARDPMIHRFVQGIAYLICGSRSSTAALARSSWRKAWRFVLRVTQTGRRGRGWKLRNVTWRSGSLRATGTHRGHRSNYMARIMSHNQ